MSRIPPEDLSRIIDYVTGETSPDETSQMEQWIRGNNAYKTLAERLRQSQVAHRDTIAAEFRLDRIVRSLDEALTQRARAGGMTNRATHVQKPLVSRLHSRGESGNAPSWRSTLAYTTLACLALITIGVITVRQATFHHAPTFVSHTYTTAAGQTAIATLRDGSHVSLGPNTTLSVATNERGSQVDVSVTGEALFTVTHHTDMSFTVHTKNMVTRVLGTTFMVRRYPSDRVTQVVVANGRVAVFRLSDGIHRDGKSYVMIAQTRSTIDDSGHVTMTPNVVVDDYTGWVTGRLVFHDTPARDVVAEIGRAYGTTIRIADSARAAQRLNWAVPLAQRSLANVLTSLSDVLDAHVVQTDRVIIFVPGKSSIQQQPVHSLSLPEREYGR